MAGTIERLMQKFNCRSQSLVYYRDTLNLGNFKFITLYRVIYRPGLKQDNLFQVPCDMTLKLKMSVDYVSLF